VNNLFNWILSGTTERILLVFYPSYMNTPSFRNVNNFVSPTVYINLVMWTISDSATLMKYISMDFYWLCSCIHTEYRKKRIKRNNKRNSFNICLLIMATRNDLSLEQKVNLSKQVKKECLFEYWKINLMYQLAVYRLFLKEKTLTLWSCSNGASFTPINNN
jgi:hypothetical protein